MLSCLVPTICSNASGARQTSHSLICTAVLHYLLCKTELFFIQTGDLKTKGGPTRNKPFPQRLVRGIITQGNGYPSSYRQHSRGTCYKAYTTQHTRTLMAHAVLGGAGRSSYARDGHNIGKYQAGMHNIMYSDCEHIICVYFKGVVLVAVV